MARTQDERKADTRARLLGAAAELFAEHGVDAVSVDAVAEAAGRTSGAVYAHFGSKQGLLIALLDEWKHSLVTVIAAEFEIATTVEDRLRAVAANVIVDPSEQTRRMLLLEEELWLRAARDPEVAAALRTRLGESHERMTRGFATWMQAGTIPRASRVPGTAGADDLTRDAAAADVATAFRAVVLGLVLQRRVAPDLVDVDSAERALATVLDLPGTRAIQNTSIATTH
jgi:AcrR family transcriptional regulator